MALPRSEEIKDLALKYSKQQLSGLAQRGEIDPMTAVMAGMMRDRIVSEEMRQNMPETTVADDILGAAQQMGQPQLVGQPQDQLAQMQRPVEGQPQMAMMAEGGLASIPFDDGMFDYAGGGIVAFSNGGASSLPIQERLRLREKMTPEERIIFDRTGQIPPRIPTPDLRAPVRMEGGRPISVDVATGRELGVPPPVIETPTEMPAVGLEQINISPLVSQATQMANAFRPNLVETVPTVEQATEQTRKLLETSGYDRNVLKDIQDDLRAQRESASAEKKEALNMRLIEAGLGIMSGTSANAFENIGKGAAPALRGLASDLKDIQKAEREYKLAQQNLRLKQNEAAMGEARVTQATIDKAQERLDKKEDDYNRLRGDITKTLLSGQVQERIARASYGSRMTDFDKKWNIYTSQAKARGETPSTEGFGKAFGIDRASLTFKDAMAIAQKDSGLTLAEAETEARRLMRLENASREGGAQGPLSEQDRQALAWANANPNDPRAKQIKEHLGVK